jgi:hypothetical protein
MDTPFNTFLSPIDSISWNCHRALLEAKDMHLNPVFHTHLISGHEKDQKPQFNAWGQPMAS